MLINLLGSIFGVNGKVLGALNGVKAYVGGFTQLLTGLSGMCVASVNVLMEFQKLTNLSDVVHFAQIAMKGQDPYIDAFGLALAIAGSGLKGIGLAHKGDKLMAVIKGNLEPPATALPAVEPPK